jgi:hypothetical protein
MQASEGSAPAIDPSLLLPNIIDHCFYEGDAADLAPDLNSCMRDSDTIKSSGCLNLLRRNVALQSQRMLYPVRLLWTIQLLCEHIRVATKIPSP